MGFPGFVVLCAVIISGCSVKLWFGCFLVWYLVTLWAYGFEDVVFSLLWFGLGVYGLV